jgi:hypothetical protein
MIAIRIRQDARRLIGRFAGILTFSRPVPKEAGTTTRAGRHVLS